MVGDLGRYSMLYWLRRSLCSVNLGMSSTHSALHGLKLININDDVGGGM